MDTLNQWVKEGRIIETTELESADSGARLSAASVPGLNFPKAAPTVADQVIQPQPQPTTTYQQPQPGPYTPPTGSPYANNPYATPPSASPYPRTGGGMTGDDGSKDVTTSFVCTGASLVCCCFLSIAGIIYANKAKEKGHPTGQAAFIFACVVLGLQAVGSIFYIIAIAAGGMRP
jgi:hypothetical protein